MKTMKSTKGNQFLLFLGVAIILTLPQYSYGQWQQANGGMLNGTHITNFALQGDKLFAGGTGDLINLILYRTADYGSSWVQSDGGILPADSLWFPEIIGSLVSLNGNLISSCSRGIYRSVDDGVSWERIAFQPLGLQADAGSLFGFDWNKNYWYWSSDYGSSWDSTVAIPVPTGVQSRGRFVKDSLMLAAFQSADSGYLFRSTDFGNTWFRVVSGLPSTGFGLSFAMTDLFIFATASTASGTIILRSSDNGQTWSQANAVLPPNYPVNAVYSYQNVLFAGTGGSVSKVFRSTDNGETWEDISSGLQSNNPNLSFIVCGSYLFVGTSYGGVWRRQLSEVYVPIQLASFTGSHLGGTRVNLDWRTISEINNYGFYVMRRRENEPTFTQISSLIPGHGTTNEPQHYSWTDSNATNARWYYKLLQIDLDGTQHYTEPILVDVTMSVSEENIPHEYRLEQNYPNPFNPSTTIKYDLPESAKVSLIVYDILGRKVAELVNEEKPAGYHSVKWNAADVASGVYLARFMAFDANGYSKYSRVNKLILMK